MSLLSAQEVEKLIHSGLPHSEEIGFKVLEVVDGGAKVSLAPRPSDIRPGGTLSGPLIMALADAAMYAAILAKNGGQMAVTSQISLNFLSRPEPKPLWASAEILKWGKRLVVCDVRVYSSVADKLVATVNGTYSLPPQE